MYNYSSKYNNVHQCSVVDNRLLWAYLIGHSNNSDELESTLKMLSEFIEEEDVSIEVVEDLIPPGYVYSRDFGFINY